MAVVGITSRATLVRAFRHACGLAPIAYLARLRFDLARQRLAGTNDPISEVAASIGCKSEAVLSKAFLRSFWDQARGGSTQSARQLAAREFGRKHASGP